MNTDEILQSLAAAAALSEEGRAGEALESLRALAGALRGRLPALTWGQYIEALEGVEADYRRLRRFALTGAADPDRPSMMEALQRRITSLADVAAHQYRLVDAPTLRHSFLRTSARHPGQGLAQEAEGAEALGRKLSDAILAADSEQKALGDLREQHERAWAQVFRRVWTMFPITRGDAAEIRRLLASPATPSWASALILSALTLQGMENPEPEAPAILAEVYAAAGTPASLSMRALAGVAMILWARPGRKLPKSVAERLAAMADKAEWADDVKALAIELARTRSTERLEKHIRDEVIPGIMRMRPEFERLAKEMNADELDTDSAPEMFDPEANPEWADMLKKSGLEDSLRKLSEMEEEGADVMMGMVGGMKQFALFNDVSAWFMPFHADHSQVAAANLPPEVTAMLEQAANLCDSDKYSLVCALTLMPNSQRREQSIRALQMQSEQYLEAITAAPLAGSPRDRRNRALRNYIQSVYRFVKKFRRKNEFADPFVSGPYGADAIDLSVIEPFKGVIERGDTLRLMAEIYLRAEAYAPAARAFERLGELHGPSDQNLQKLGFALKRMNRPEEAMEAWSAADLINPSSLWTLRRLSSTARELGRDDEALAFQQRLVELDPDNPSAALTIGMSYINAGRIDEALKQLFKADFLYGNDPNPRRRGRAQRPLAWALMLKADYVRARTYIERSLAAGAEPSDWLNLGHLELLSGNPSQAVDAYVKAIEAENYDIAAFRRRFHTDAATLLFASLPDPLLPRLVLDEAAERAAANGSHIPE